MNIRHASDSNIGLIRKVNQDRWSQADCDWGYFFSVADGMGHKEGGQIASQTTVDLLKERFSMQDPGNIPDFFRQSLKEINSIIYKKKADLFGHAMLGTTCVTAIIQPSLPGASRKPQGNLPVGRVYVAHVGDSRIYHLQGDTLTRLTKDQSLVQEMIDGGLITEKEAENHPNKNIVTEALGAHDTAFPVIPTRSIELRTGDKLLLCTDGLWGMISPDQLHKTLQSDLPEDEVKTLIKLALRTGGPDNVTVQVIHISD